VPQERAIDNALRQFSVFLDGDPRRVQFARRAEWVFQFLAQNLQDPKMDKDSAKAYASMADAALKAMESQARAMGLNLKATQEALNLSTAEAILDYVEEFQTRLDKAQEALERSNPTEYTKLMDGLARRGSRYGAPKQR
jgi:hypothetical protein